jgi:hypothetical protein
MKLFMWNWHQGGYNSTRAETKEEAIQNGNSMCKGLKVDEHSVREVTLEELVAEDERWGPYD